MAEPTSVEEMLSNENVDISFFQQGFSRFCSQVSHSEPSRSNHLEAVSNKRRLQAWINVQVTYSDVSQIV